MPKEESKSAAIRSDGYRERPSILLEAPLLTKLLAVKQLSLPHPDPADRFLTATGARVTLVMADERLLGLVTSEALFG